MTTQHPESAAELREGLAADLRARGLLDDPRLYQAFAEVPREEFLPAGFLTQVTSANGAGWTPAQLGSADYLREVYRDVPLVTQIDGRVAPADVPDGTAVGGEPTCSSTQPALMALMLDQLRLEAGMRVLEIGAGVGYNAALMAHRLGPGNVTSIEYDPELADAARRSLLAHTGHALPLVVTGDGAAGHPAEAPYDRLIATCAFPEVPAAWLQQLRPGAVAIVNIYRPLGTGILAVLRVQDDQTALGRIAPDFGGFMPTRAITGIDPLARHKEVWRELAEAETHPSKLPMSVLDDRAFRLHASLTLPAVDLQFAGPDPSERALWLFAADGSAARATPTRDGTQIVEHGPARLWSALEQAHDEFEQLGRPDRGSYRININADEQFVWHPSLPEQRWPLRSSDIAVRV